MQVQTRGTMPRSAMKNFQIRHFAICIHVKQVILTKIADINKQTFESEQKKWLRECHKASHVGNMLLRQQLFKSKCS